MMGGGCYLPHLYRVIINAASQITSSPAKMLLAHLPCRGLPGLIQAIPSLP